MTEQILVVPRSKLFAGRPVPHGFGKDDLEGLVKRIYENGYFIDRPEAENNPNLKQIIPYLLVSAKATAESREGLVVSGANLNDKIFVLHRQTKQTEKRLHDKYSIGVGGHINPEIRNQKSEVSLRRGWKENCTKSYPLKVPININ